MAKPFDDLLSAVRNACLPGLWSQGVKLAREGAVFDPRTQPDATVVRVRAPGVAVAPTITLYPEDEEWTCDCGGKIDPCAHVAAAVIALAQGSAKPAPPEATAAAAETAAASPAAPGAAAPASPASPAAPAPRQVARLAYQIAVKSGALRLERWLIQPDGRKEPFLGSLARMGSQAIRELALYPTHEDLSIDRLVGGRQFGYWPIDRIAEVFSALVSAPDVRFEGRPIQVSTTLIVPRAKVLDHEKGGVVLVVDRDPRVSEVLTSGVVLCGETLHRLGELELGGGRLEKLPLRRVFSKSDLGQLVTKVLPDLRKRIPLEIQSKRLPAESRGERPRILFRLDQQKHALSVVPELVYGDPPSARIEQGKLLHLSGPVPIRDEPRERELMGRLRDELNLIPGRVVHFDGAEAVRFASKLEDFSAKEGGEVHRKLFGQAKLLPKILIDDRHFEICFELEPGEGGQEGEDEARFADPAAVLKAYRSGLSLVPLEGGGFAPLPREFLDKHADRLAELYAAKQDDGTVATAALPALAELCDALERPRPPSYDTLAPLFEGFVSIPEAKLPEDLTATLRHYQQEGVNWLCFLREAGLGAVLADDMGLGKTLQALGSLKGRSLVVCPRSVVYNWAEEIRRFRPKMRVSIYHGPKRALDPSADITLTTYALLRIDASILAEVVWDTVVLDEAQAIKSPDSQVARAAYGLNAAHRISLSGTPVENRLEELWSQMHFANRGLLGGFSDFQERYARPIEAGVPGAASRLREKIRPFVLRRLKGEVAPELPPRTESVLYCELDESERTVYDAMLFATRKEVVEKLAGGGGVLAALEALLRLRQAACHTALLPGQKAESSSKVERLVEALEDAAADGHKALVFSQWTSLLDLVEPQLEKAGIAFTRLDGSTRDRGAVVAKFQDEKGPPVILISLKAGGTGLNLTAADHVFLLDPWWNPAVEDQAADRAHRIGQDKPVMVYRLVAKDTVEEGILVLQERKRQLADAALGEADRAAALTREDLLALLG